MTPITRRLEAEYNKALQMIARKHGIRAATPVLAKAIEKKTIGRFRYSNVWFVSGISGSGKSTIVKFLERHGFRRVPNVVTRKKRPEESESDAVFADTATFLKWRKRGLLFHPHKTNAVWHAMRKSDIEKMVRAKNRLYADKSVKSILAIIDAYPRVRDSVFLYILPPSFRELHARLSKRESDKTRRGLTQRAIHDRFAEEIVDMRRSMKIPSIYILNDSKVRVRKVLNAIIKRKAA